MFLSLADANLTEIGFDPSIDVEIAKLHDRWLGYCQGTSVATEIRNDVMISFCAEVYKYLLRHCTSVQEAISTEISLTDAWPVVCSYYSYRRQLGLLSILWWSTG